MSSPLVRYRSQNGLTIDQLAAALGVDKSTISRWENGRVPVERVRDVERITGISRLELRPDVFGEAA